MAEHQAEAADHVGNRVFQAKGDGETANAEGGEQGGRIHAEYRLQHGRHRQHPYDHAQDIHEDRGVRHLRTVENLAYHARKRLVDDDGDQHDDGKEYELPIVGL